MAMSPEEVVQEDAFEREMDAVSTVYSLRPGHTLTQADYDAIQLYDRVNRRDEDRAIEVFHKGYTQGLREGGSADIEAMKAKLDGQFIELSVENVMRSHSEQRAEELQAALDSVMPILARAESNASGNPEFDYVGPLVAAVRALSTPTSPAA